MNAGEVTGVGVLVRARSSSRRHDARARPANDYTRRDGPRGDPRRLVLDGLGARPSGRRPRHRVWLDRFAIARAPVTNREYAGFLGDGETEPPAWWQDSRFNDPEQPVVGVSWFDATRFCRWLADREVPVLPAPERGPVGEGRARPALDDARFPWGEDRPADGRLGPAAPRRPTRPPTARPGRPLGRVPRMVSGLGGRGLLRAITFAEPSWPGGGHAARLTRWAWRHQDAWSPVAHRSSLPPALPYSDYGFRVVCETT